MWKHIGNNPKDMLIIFLVIPIIAAKSIDVTNNNGKPTGVVIQISECFPFCGVAAQLKDNFRPCFPFCHVPVFQMGNLLIVEELPSCFPMCGDQGFSKVLGKNDSRKPTETSPMSTSSLFGRVFPILQCFWSRFWNHVSQLLPVLWCFKDCLCLRCPKENW